MAKKTWNNFQKLYPTSVTFVANVSSRLPAGLMFDKNKNRLPTPYGLFSEWADKNLSGDWASTSLPKVGFALAVTSQADAKLIQSKFGPLGKAKKTPVGDRTIQCSYRDSDYGNLAKSLGYKL